MANNEATITLLKSVLNFYNADKKHWVKRMNFGSRALAAERKDGGGPIPVHAPNEADCCCLRGALIKFGCNFPRYGVMDRAVTRVADAIREARPGRAGFSCQTTIVAFNDEHETSLRDVKKVLKRAIELEATAA